MNKLCSVYSIAVCLFSFSQQVCAHVGYGNLGVFTNTGDTGTITLEHFQRYGWLDGADNDLGDSHKVAGASGFFKFTLTQSGEIQINVSSTSNLMNPAFSVYSGVLPALSHDNDYNDPNAVYDSNFLYAASPRDMHPGDPQISHFIPVGYDASGAPLKDPSGRYALLTENPIWNTPDPNGVDLGGLTPAQWYEVNYQPHNGYRDTLNFTPLGGLVFNPEFGWVPANFNIDNGPYEGYSGQFDAFGSWSMSNENGQWSKIGYISSVSRTPCTGPNCITTTTGGFINPGHFSGNDGLSETITLALQQGTYTIAVDGEACNDFSSECRDPFLSASVTATVVPIPGAMGLLMSGLVGIRALNGFSRVRFRSLNRTR